MRHCLAVILACLAFASPLSAASLEEAGRLRWRENYDGFGSYSGLALSDDGRRFVTVADKGHFATGRLERKDGKLHAVILEDHGPILDPKGQPVRRYDIDAEGLTLTPDGTLWVSFEANHRVWGYTDMRLAATETARHPDYAKLQNNSSLEALASDADGNLYTIPERSGKLTRPFPVYRYSGSRWTQPFAVPRSGDFLMVGAEFGPDGWLYVLERDFRTLSGFRTRIRRFRHSPDGLSDEETLLETRFGRLDNMEGIDVWRDADGAIRLTLISDDNYSFFQSTIFVEYVLRP
ncbi:esterase-like activity of phytase family protein [Halovulum sp. GXIMD14793]